MGKGGKRPNSGRKKGSIPWNKGVPMRLETRKKLSESNTGQIPWNLGKNMPESMRVKMLGNKNGRGNKGRKDVSKERILAMVLARQGRSGMTGKKLSLDSRLKMSKSRRSFFERNGFVLSQEPHHVLARDRKKIRRERLLKNGGSHSRKEWESLKEAHQYRFVLCQKREPEVRLTRDHILAILRGGTDDIENIQPLCVICNSRKGIN